MFRRAEDKFSDGPRTAVVNGDAENIEDWKKAMHGQDVVYCAISEEALLQCSCGIKRHKQFGIQASLFRIF